jgi:hypothetical protein
MGNMRKSAVFYRRLARRLPGLALHARFKSDFRLHECHTLGDDDDGDEISGKKVPDVIDQFVIDLVDAEGQAMDTIGSNQLAFQCVEFFDEIVKFFKKRGVVQFGADLYHGIARKPAALVVGVENLEIASLNFDHQPQLFRELKLVSIMFGSAVDEVADMDGFQFQLSSLDGAHKIGNSFQVDMSIGAAGRTVGIASHFKRAERHCHSIVNQETSDQRFAYI